MDEFQPLNANSQKKLLQQHRRAHHTRLGIDLHLWLIRRKILTSNVGCSI